MKTTEVSARRETASGAAAEQRDLPAEKAVREWLLAYRRARGAACVSTTMVSIADALGSVLAEPVWARRCSPAFPAAAMDGIAVTAADTMGAAPGRRVRLGADRFEVVDTGNPLPAGRDAVVVRERVRFEGAAVEIEAQAAPGQHVRGIGEDIATGELLLAPGHRLRPIDLAAAAAAGLTKLAVRRPVRVSILPTGDELRPAGAELAPGELADTNSLMLDGLSRESGCTTRVWPILPDDPNRLAEALVAAADESDLVLLVAGTSAGRHDHAPEVLRECGQIVVHGVAIRPGHPAILGVAGGAAVMACPGYPVSAALAFEELARPLIASLEGVRPPSRPAVGARMAADARPRRGARALLRVRVGTVDGARVAIPLRGGASVLTSLVHADALLPTPADLEAIAASSPVKVEPLLGTSERGRSLLLAGAPDRALDLLGLAFDARGRQEVRVAFCEIAPAGAIALVRDRSCHAAAVGRVGSVAPSDQLLRVQVAACKVGLVSPSGRPVGRDPLALLRGRVRVAAGPDGTPARLVLERVARGLGMHGFEIVEARSDAAALATLATGYADFAVSIEPAAAQAGLAVSTLGRAALDLLIDRGVAARDPLARDLLHTVRSRAFEIALERAGYEPRVPPRLHMQRSRARAVRTINVQGTPEVSL